MTQDHIKYEFVDHLIERQHKNELKMLKELRKGDYTMEEPLIVNNPYLINDLAAAILFNTEEETAITVRVKGKTKEADMMQTFPKGTEHVLPIVGLYSDYENTVEVWPYQKESQKVVHKIKTEKVFMHDSVKKIETTPEYMDGQVMFLCPATGDLAIAVDYAGDLRLSFNVPMLWDVKTLPNGHYQMSSGRQVGSPYFTSGIYNFSPVGKIYREYRVPRGYHHDQYILPNGDIIALNCNWDNGTVEDMAVLIDKETGAVKKEWDFADFIEPGAQKSGSWSDEDWFHCNAVWYDEHTNSLTFSGRHINAMVNIDYDSSELNWIISDPEGWPEEYKEYLFTPVGEGEFDWQYEQHSNLITPYGDVMCFDNHHWGSQNPDKYLAPNDSYSRGVQYHIDTDTMEIEQVWQYGKERGHEFYSPYICNVKYYNEGHYLVHSGGIAFEEDGSASSTLGSLALAEDPNRRLQSTTVEVFDDEVVFELQVESNYYRANRMDLYNRVDSSQDLVLGKGTIVGSLGETKQTDYEIPAEKTGELLEDWHEAEIVDQADMFTFTCKFEKGDLVILQLDNGKELRQYFISTAKGKRGAMCAGTFLPDDDRETRTAIMKEGLEGTYDVRVLIDDKVYETGVQITA